MYIKAPNNSLIRESCGMHKHLTLFILLGIFYMATEVTYTAITAWEFRLVGQTSLWMFVVGGFLGVLLGMFSKGSLILDKKSTYVMRIFAGALAVTLMELLSGCVLNLWLGFNLWDYSKQPLNFLGQISLYHSMLWLLFTPFVFWLDAVIRHYVHKERRPLPLYMYYLDIFRKDTPLDD